MKIFFSFLGGMLGLLVLSSSVDGELFSYRGGTEKDFGGTKIWNFWNRKFLIWKISEIIVYFFCLIHYHIHICVIYFAILITWYFPGDVIIDNVDSDEACHNLHPVLDGHMMSFDPMGTCFVLYMEPDCQGFQESFSGDPTDDLDNRGPPEFNLPQWGNKARGISLCPQ